MFAKEEIADFIRRKGGRNYFSSLLREANPKSQSELKFLNDNEGTTLILAAIERIAGIDTAISDSHMEVFLLMQSATHLLIADMISELVKKESAALACSNCGFRAPLCDCSASEKAMATSAPKKPPKRRKS